MAEYMDLFVIRTRGDRKIVAQAPWLSHIEVGYEVASEDFNGTVIAKMDVREDNTEIFDFLRALTDDSDEDIPKVRTYYKEIEVKYDK